MKGGLWYTPVTVTSQPLQAMELAWGEQLTTLGRHDAPRMHTELFHAGMYLLFPSESTPGTLHSNVQSCNNQPPRNQESTHTLHRFLRSLHGSELGHVHIDVTRQLGNGLLLRVAN
jgi:hypothetical protein